MISFDDFFNFVMAIFLIVFCIWFYSKFFKFVFKLLTFPFRLILAPFKFIKSIFTGSSNTHQRPKKKMGFIKKLAIAGAAAHTARVAHNVANPPTVFVEVPYNKFGNNNYEIRLGSSTPLKNGSGYRINYTLINNRSNSNTPTVRQKSRDVERKSHGGSSYITEWGCKIKVKWS